MIKSELIYYLHAISKYQSLTIAAENLYMTQPALSIAIKNLEKKMGFALVTKSHNRIQLTTEAEKILSLSQPVLRGLNEIEVFINDQITEEVHCVFPQYTSHVMIPHIITNSLEATNLNIDFLYCSSDTELMEIVSRNTHCVGIVFVQDIQKINTFPNFNKICSEQFYLLCNKNTKFFSSNRTTISLDELSNIPLVTMPGGETMNYLTNYLESKKQLNIFKQVNNINIMYSYVYNDQAVGICLGFNKEIIETNTQGNFRFIKITDIPITHCCLFSSPDLSSETCQKLSNLIHISLLQS